jgi:hypothetical protein
VSALQPIPLDADRARLSALEAQLTEREQELDSLRAELRHLQTRYLDEIGPCYAELSTLEAQVVELEVRLGLRPPPLFDEDEGDDEAGGDDARASSCASPAAPSADLKRVFRDLAKAIHPDRAMDDRARYRRQSLMAEANRAYAERDEDRLRLILSAWERNADVAIDDEDADAGTRIRRRIALVDERLIAIAAELADLRSSAIWRLKGKIDDARAQGWDLFAEMILQVKREISRATMRLASLNRQTAR